MEIEKEIEMSTIDKSKQEKTLQDMKERRASDYIFLRDIVIKKLKWAEKEKQLGYDTLKNLEIQKNSINQQILRLEGIILVLKELSEMEPKKQKDQK